MLEPSRAITECSKPLASVGPDRRCPKCFQALKKKSGAVVQLPQSLLSSLVDSSNVSNDCFTASAVSLLLLFHCFIWKWEWITRIQGSLENIEKFSSNTPWWLSLLKNYHWHLCTLCIILVFFTSFVISTSTWILRNPKKKQASPHMSQAHMWSSFDKSWMSAMASRCLEHPAESVLYFCVDSLASQKKMRGMIFTITWLSTCKEVEVVFQRNARYWRCDGRWRFVKKKKTY